MSLCESFEECFAMAASWEELDVACWTTSRIFSIARTTDCTPVACSSIVELISWVISVSREVAFEI